MSAESRFDQQFLKAVEDAYEQLRFVVLEALSDGGPTSAETLADALSLPTSLVRGIFEAESASGVLTETSTQGEFTFTNCDGE